MNRRKPSQTSGQVQHNASACEVIDRLGDYDTSSSAWAEFDLRITNQIAQLEAHMRQYFTPVATRNELGR